MLSRETLAFSSFESCRYLNFLLGPLDVCNREMNIGDLMKGIFYCSAALSFVVNEHADNNIKESEKSWRRKRKSVGI